MTAKLARAALFFCLAITQGCRHTAVAENTAAAVQEAAARGPAAYLAGRVVALSEPWVLEDRDFVYAIALAPDSKRAAFTVLRAPDVKLVISKLDPLVPEAAVSVVGHYSMDAESVAFSPDGRAVVAVSRDGTARVFSAEDGKSLGGYATEEPLVSLAFHPSGDYLFVGSARGLVTALHFPSMQFAAEERLHSDEVRGLAVSEQGVLFSGSWDKSVVAVSTEQKTVAATQTRLHFQRQGNATLARGTVDGVGGLFSLDARSPHVIVHSDLAKAIGVDLATLKETVSIPTPLGKSLGRIARGHRVGLKTLTFPKVDLVVCDACLPTGVHVLLGAPVLHSLDVAFDDTTGEVQLTRKNKKVGESVTTLVFGEPRRMPQEGFINDVSVDRAGKVLALAMSKEKAERTIAVREREKKGVKPAKDPLDAALRIDAETGKVLDRWSPHDGVIATATVSPDGLTVATGGWDGRVCLLSPGKVKPVADRQLGWIIRRTRFSSDGRLLAVGAWTPPKPSQTAHSEPAALVYELGYDAPKVESVAKTASPPNS